MKKVFISPTNLKALRDRKEWSRKKLSQMSGVTERSITSYEKSEKSKVSLTRKNLRKLASALEESQEVLSGNAAVPAEDITHEISLRLDSYTKLNLDLIKEKYGFTIEDIVNVAPLLFVKAAQEAKVRQFQKIKQDQAILDSCKSPDEAGKAILKEGWPNVPEDFDFINYFNDREDAARNNDLTDKLIFDNYGDENNIFDHVNPFSIYLYDECTEHQLGEMRGGYSNYFGYFSNPTIPIYQVCLDQLEKITCGSIEATVALKFGMVTLGEIPEELKEPGEAGKRVAWLEDKYWQSDVGKIEHPDHDGDYFDWARENEAESESAEPILNCNICMDKRYVVCKRDDDFLAVERCDACSEDTVTDQQAAALAEADNIGVSHESPHYLTDQENPDDWEQMHQNTRKPE